MKFQGCNYTLFIKNHILSNRVISHLLGNSNKHLVFVLQLLNDPKQVMRYAGLVYWESFQGELARGFTAKKGAKNSKKETDRRIETSSPTIVQRT